MSFATGSVDVGDEPVRVCAVPEDGVLVKNSGDVPLWFGGPGVLADGSGAGFPLDPGESQTLPGAKPKDSPVVPAPPGDMSPVILYARAAGGTQGKAAYLAISKMGGVASAGSV